MASSQNGWQVFEAYGAPLVSNPIPGTGGIKFLGGLDPRVDVIMRYVGHRWHTEVEPITGPADQTGQWGYNYRAIRGQSSGFSNHASGTAVDINSAAHPLGSRTLGSVKLAAIARIRDDLQGAVRFGAFYDGRPDEMHAEVNADPGEIARVTALIVSGQLPNVPADLLTSPPTPPKPAPSTTPPEDEMSPDDRKWIEDLLDRKLAADSAADDIVINPETKNRMPLGDRIIGTVRVMREQFAKVFERLDRQDTRLDKIERKVGR